MPITYFRIFQVAVVLFYFREVITVFVEINNTYNIQYCRIICVLKLNRKFRNWVPCVEIVELWLVQVEGSQATP
jgi:hypothetical protein